jgi:hypothetical protein
MAITNPCGGSGQEPTRTRRLPMSMGTKFGGRLMGCCPEEGCEAFVTRGGKLTKHEPRPGAFMRSVQSRAQERPDPNENDPRHWS